VTVGWASNSRAHLIAACSGDEDNDNDAMVGVRRSPSIGRSPVDLGAERFTWHFSLGIIVYIHSHFYLTSIQP
jgi:hypothetical protein